jgi:hypothetical protein
VHTLVLDTTDLCRLRGLPVLGSGSRMRLWLVAGFGIGAAALAAAVGSNTVVDEVFAQLRTRHGVPIGKLDRIFARHGIPRDRLSLMEHVDGRVRKSRNAAHIGKYPDSA